MPAPTGRETQRVHRGELINQAGDALGPLGEQLSPLLAGGGGADLGTEHVRQNEEGMADKIANGDEIVPLDPTKPTLVNFRGTGPTGGAQINVGSWPNNTLFSAFAAEGHNAGVLAWFAAGESYYCEPNGAGTVSLRERSIG